MSVRTILKKLARRKGSLRWQDNRLMVFPKSALDDALRAEMRLHRAELEEIAKAQSLPIVEATIAIFGGEVVAVIEPDYDPAHIPATVIPSCFTVGGACRAYSEAQLNGMTEKMLSEHTQNCGDCDLFRTRLKLARMEEKRKKIEAREKAREQANREAHALSEVED